MSTVTVSRQWLEEAMQANQEMAWSLETAIRHLQESPEDSLAALEHIRIAAMDQAKGFAQQLGTVFDEAAPKPTLRVVKEERPDE